MICQNKGRLLLQFHITGRCNLRCKHCYRTEGDVEPLSTDDVFLVLEQYESLRRRYNETHGIQARGHINITGGEPFIREDVDQILGYLGEHREQYSFGVLSNGSFLDADRMALLKSCGVSFVQLSLDGEKAIHDALRAPGDYDRTLRTAALLEEKGITAYISFTANRQNHRCLPGVAKACRAEKITKLWTDRLVILGNGKELQELAITKDMLPDYLRSLKKAQGSWMTRLLHPKTRVAADRALQFLGANGRIYSCSAGDTLITVDEFGQIMPCRRMPIICGNVFDSTLEDVYFGDGTFRDLRKGDIPKACSGCVYRYHCRGGARCQSYGAYGDYLRADPACPFVAE